MHENEPLVIKSIISGGTDFKWMKYRMDMEMNANYRLTTPVEKCRIKTRVVMELLRKV